VALIAFITNNSTSASNNLDEGDGLLRDILALGNSVGGGYGFDGLVGVITSLCASLLAYALLLGPTHRAASLWPMHALALVLACFALSRSVREFHLYQLEPSLKQFLLTATPFVNSLLLICFTLATFCGAPMYPMLRAAHCSLAAVGIGSVLVMRFCTGEAQGEAQYPPLRGSFEASLAAYVAIALCGIWGLAPSNRQRLQAWLVRLGCSPLPEAGGAGCDAPADEAGVMGNAEDGAANGAGGTDGSLPPQPAVADRNQPTPAFQVPTPRVHALIAALPAKWLPLTALWQTDLELAAMPPTTRRGAAGKTHSNTPSSSRQCDSQLGPGTWSWMGSEPSERNDPSAEHDTPRPSI
jgi:hypothetical protein